MAFISIRSVIPHPGKDALVVERARTLGEIYNRYGARTRVARVAAGDGAGQIYLAVAVDNGKTLAAAYDRVQADPAFAKLLQEREQNHGGTMTGPEVYRTVHGQVQPGHSVVLMREYAVARDKLESILALMPELDTLVQAHDVKVLASLPVFSADMERMIAAYYFRSAAHLGDAMDGVGQSAEFQTIVTRAAAFGRLVRSRVVVNI